MNVHEPTILNLSKLWAGSPKNGSMDLLWKGVIIFDLVEKAPQKYNYSHEGSPNAGFSVGKLSTEPGEEGVNIRTYESGMVGSWQCFWRG